LSDPVKRGKYDKYGTVDEDDWDYEEFMKNFHFEDIFKMFDDDMFNV
jgi:DnaJ-class molecular chaperone